MRAMIVIVCFCVTSCTIPVYSADDAPLVDRLSRSVSDQTIAIVRIDLSRASVETLALPLAILKSPLGDPGLETPEQLLAAAKPLGDAGIRYVYLLVDLPERVGMKSRIAGVIPIEKKTQIQPATEGWPRLFDSNGAKGWTFIQSDSEVRAYPTETDEAAQPANNSRRTQFFNALAGNSRAETTPPQSDAPSTSSNREPSPRPQFAKALTAVGDAALAVAIVPSADQRRVFAELLPYLSDELQPAIVRPLAEHVAWCAIGFDPGKSLRIVLQTDSAAQAGDAASVLTEIMEKAKLAVATNQEFAPYGPLLNALKPEASGDQVILELDESQAEKLDNALKPLLAMTNLGADRGTAMRWMKHVGLGFHNYAAANKDAKGRHPFPDTASHDIQGKPLLSWRVHLLPYLDERELYQQFHLDEPWDSEHNRPLIKRIPRIYRIGSLPTVAEGKTCLVVPIGEKTISPGGLGLEIKEITDGTSNTILAVEVDDEHAVPWTKPDDLQFDPAKPTAGLGHHFGDGFLALYADGSVRFISGSESPDVIRTLFTATARDIATPTK